VTEALTDGLAFALKDPNAALDLGVAGEGLAPGDDLTRVQRDAGPAPQQEAARLLHPNAALDIFVREVPEIGITPTGRENARVSQGLMHYTSVSASVTARHSSGSRARVSRRVTT
jgi:hypothetical protein